MKEKIYETLLTPYAEEMDKNIPWNVYPRPQMKRDSFLCLNGEWDFKIADKADTGSGFDEKILVPFPPESKLSGIEKRIQKGKILVYRRFFTLPEGFVRDSVILHFGAVDQICEVFVNGSSVGTHVGGYIPFSFDITDNLKSGENEIIVKVLDDLCKTYTYGKQKIKRGGMWYTPVSGIWQTVWIESLPKKPIYSIKIEQSTKNAKITVNSEAEIKKLTLKADGSVYEFTADSVTIEPENKILWTPETPYFTAVFSPEPVREGAMILCEEQNKKSNMGTISYIPATFGIGCASVVIRGLIDEF